MAETITVGPLTAGEISHVNDAIAEAERNTSGEIIAVVAGRSSVYWHAPYEAGLWFAGIAVLFATIGSLLANGDWPVWHIGWYVAITVGGFLTGFFATRVANIERFFADRAIMRAECEERAHRLFSEYGLFRTTARTGVLVYVSLFEHVVIVLGDSGISAKIGPNEYTTIVDAMIKRIQQGKLEQALIEGIETLGTHLTASFPRLADDVNELPDRLYVLP